MAGPAAMGFAVCIVLAVIVIRLIARRRPHRATPADPQVRTLLAAARRRAVIAIAFTATVFVALFTAGFVFRDLVGLPFALAPALSGAAGLLLYSVTPPRAVAIGSEAERVASLTPRTPLTHLPRPAAVVFVAVVTAQIAFLLFTGVTSSPDESGRYRMIAFQFGDHGSASSPYAGWFYGVPLLAATGILTGATIVALWRVSATPALPHSALSDVDAGWRRATNRIMVSIATAAVLLQFGGVAIQSGISMRNAYFDGVPFVWDVIGQLCEGVGVLMLIASVATLTLAALWALTLPDLAMGGGAAKTSAAATAAHAEVAR